MNDLDLADISNVPAGFILVVVTMIVMVVFLFWFLKQKQWIVSNDHDYGDKLKQKNKHKDSNAS
jgi:magnesium transporter